MNAYFIGIDLGGTNVEVALLDAGGKVVGRESTPSEISAGPDALVNRVAVLFDNLITQTGVSRDGLKGIGIGSPGPLSVAQGKIIKAGNLPGFDNYPLRAKISAQLKVPAVFDNDANVACWGEFWRGAGQNVTDMVMFTLGTGVGGGIVCNGELIHGSEDNGAELGHMIVEPGGRLCGCGQYGCLESHASASHTANRAGELLADGAESSLQDIFKNTGKVTCKDIFDHAKAGDSLANQVVDGTTKAIAQACVNLRHILEPQMVVLAGGMINAGPMLVERIQRDYDAMMWTLKPEPMAIKLAQLGDAAGVIGAAGLALHCYERDELHTIGT